MGDVNIDLKDLAGVGEAIEKGSRGLARLFPGWARRSEVNAERRATEQALQSVREIRRVARQEGLSEDVTDYFCRDSVRRITRNENLDQIVSFAAPMVDEDAEVSDLVGSEWLNYYVDHAERVTDDEAQRAWASVLAGEVNKRGSFSKNTMQVLSVMDTEDAKSFRKLCLFIADGIYGRTLVMAVDEDGTSYNDGTLTYTEMSNLAALGLIDMGGSANLSLGKSVWALFAEYGDLSVSVSRAENGGERFTLSPILTRVGEELSRLCDERDMPGIVRTLEAKAGRDELRIMTTPKGGNQHQPG